MGVDDDEVVPLLDSKQVIIWDREALFVLLVCLGYGSFECLGIRRVFLAERLGYFLDLLSSFVELSDFPSDLPYFVSHLVWYRYLFAHPARNGSCWVGDRLDEYLVASDALHHRWCSPDDELRTRLPVLCHESFVQDADSHVRLLLDYEVLFLIRYHRELVEVVRVEILDSRRPHHHLVLLRDPSQARKTRVHIVRNRGDVFFGQVPIWERFRYQFNKLVVVPFSVLYQQPSELVAESVERFLWNRHFLQVLAEGSPRYD